MPAMLAFILHMALLLFPSSFEIHIPPTMKDAERPDRMADDAHISREQ